MNKGSKLILMFLSLFCSRRLSAELQYLKIPVFARPEGMAGAYTGIALGPESLYYNPAGPVHQEGEKSALSVGHTAWLEGINKESAVFLLPANHYLKGVGIDYYSVPGLDSYDGAGNKTGSLGYQDTSVTLNWGIKKELASLGGNVKYLKERIGQYKGSGYALDLGALVPLLPALKFGCSLSNLGRFDLNGQKNSLPRILRTGLGLEVEEMFLIGVDLERTGGRNYMHLGGEISQSGYSLRLGWQETDRSGLYTLGAGVRTDSGWGAGQDLVINYSYMGGGYFDTAIHRFDIGVEF